MITVNNKHFQGELHNKLKLMEFFTNFTNVCNFRFNIIIELIEHSISIVGQDCVGVENDHRSVFDHLGSVAASLGTVH